MLARRNLPLIASLALPLAARAQPWAPDRPIRVIVPFGAGGPSDVVARLLAEPAGAALGQPIVVENRAGAGGNLGTRAVAQAAPDGHTLVVNAASPLVINQFLYREMGYDPAALTPIAQLATGPLLVIANPRLNIASMGDLVEAARRRPGELNYATAGNGTVPHLATELFMQRAGVRLTNVTYRQTPDATQSVMRGDTAVFFDAPQSMQYVRTDQLRALAVTTPRRFSGFPEVPTVAESGGPEMSVEAWYGLLAPPATPQPIIARLHAAFVEALRRPDVTARLSMLGFEPVGSSPAEFARFLSVEAPKWREVIETAKVRIE